jgi:hypothetical protein
MKRTIKSRRSLPSPGLVVAIVALVASVAGTAVAGVAIRSSLDAGEKRQVERIAKRVANEQIGKRALGRRVITRVESVEIPDDDRAGTVAECAPGEKMIGGGLVPVGPEELLNVVASGPPFETEGVPNPDGSPLPAWVGFMRNDEGTAGGGPGGTATLHVYAVCSP